MALQQLLGPALALFAAAANVAASPVPSNEFDHAPLRTYASDSSIAVPQLQYTGQDTQALDGNYIFISHHGGVVPKKDDGLAIMESNGEPVWVTSQFGHVHNFRVQHFKGRPHLSLWAGLYTDGVPRGMIHLLDETYTVVENITTDPLPDLHEFQVADGGNSALVAVQKYSQSHLGTTLGTWVKDTCFHQIDIYTGDKTFEWCAADHVSPDNSYVPKAFNGFSKEGAHDFFHLNSVVKDEQGNYLVSGRSMHALYYLDPAGRLIWQLGGVENDFSDKGFGDWHFGWQHHASWVPSMATDTERCISIFDNGTNGFALIATRWTSRGIIVCIDEQQMTARLHAEYKAPEELYWEASSSQGSIQVMDDGNVLVGYGKEPFFAVYEPNGKRIMTAQVGSHAESYRTLVSPNWVGKPQSDPKMVVQDSEEGDDSTTLLVSWNGATEVAKWQVLGGSNADDLQAIQEAPKTGFETTISISSEPAWLQIAALDSIGQVLGRTKASHRQSSAAELADAQAKSEADASAEQARLQTQTGSSSGLSGLLQSLWRWLSRRS